MFWKQENVKFELVTTSQKLVVDGLKVKICAINKHNKRQFMEALCSDKMEVQFQLKEVMSFVRLDIRLKNIPFILENRTRTWIQLRNLI